MFCYLVLVFLLLCRYITPISGRNENDIQTAARPPVDATRASFWVSPSVSVHQRGSVLQSLGAGLVEGDSWGCGSLGAPDFFQQEDASRYPT